jgi:hypothetical protein
MTMDATTATVLTALIGGIVTIVNTYFLYKGKVNADASKASAQVATTGQKEVARMKGELK